MYDFETKIDAQACNVSYATLVFKNYKKPHKTYINLMTTFGVKTSGNIERLIDSDYSIPPFLLNNFSLSNENHNLPITFY